MDIVLIIGMVWPEPQSSAAGVRMMQLVEYFLANKYRVHFASAARKNKFSFPLESLGVIAHEIHLNNDQFPVLLKTLNPRIVVFDRFVTEEQFGWQVDQEVPQAVKVLDTEDLHFLRHARHDQYKNPSQGFTLHTDFAKREIASIWRCDLSLIISEYEMGVLRDSFQVPKDKILYLPFLESPITKSDTNKWLPFEERKNIIFMGNFLHAPNWETVRILKTKVWPELRKLLPEAQLHIYGAYETPKVTQLHNEKERFLVKGRAEDARKTIGSFRLLLAPIPFGAGVKGKFIDAMRTGTPSITSSIGAEGMRGTLPWAGSIVDNKEDLLKATVQLYTHSDSWKKAQENGISILNKRYTEDSFIDSLTHQLNHLFVNLRTFREKHFLGEILKTNTINSLKYMSLWIQEKNKNT